MHLEPIAALLETLGCGVQGKSIFINTMRVEDSGLMLKPAYPGTDIDYELPGYYKGKFALVARGKGYVATQALIERAMKAITIETETELGAMLVKYCRPRTLPINYPIPASGQVECVVNIDCCYVMPYSK